jgi:hypothetical protein
MEDQMASYKGKTLPSRICGYVFDVGLSPKEKCENPIANALVELYCVNPATAKPPPSAPDQCVHSGENGAFEFCDLEPRKYWLCCSAFFAKPICIDTTVEAGCTAQVCFEIPLGFELASLASAGDCQPYIPCDNVTAGAEVMITATFNEDACPGEPPTICWETTGGVLDAHPSDPKATYLLTAAPPRGTKVSATITDTATGAIAKASTPLIVRPPPGSMAQSFAGGPAGSLTRGPVGGPAGSGAGGLDVRLQRSFSPPTPDLGLWAAIRSHSKAVSFGGMGMSGRNGVRALRGYQGFIEQVLCGDASGISVPNDACDYHPGLASLQDKSKQAKQLPMHGMAAYELLKTATEIFLLWNCGIAVRELDALGNPVTTAEEESARTGLPVAQVMKGLTDYLGTNRLPYIERVVQTAFPGYVASNSVFCTNVLTPRADCVCLIELIWSYWHEEAMLVQTMNAISQRFQNVRSLSERDPLAHVTIDPLRPLNNLLWGYVQDEQNRLTVKRRGAEYDHEYGITLRGKAVNTLRPADSRSKFLEGFHNLLHKCSVFYKEDNDTTVISDGFPLLNALKEVHLLLAQGAHNQFGDLPWAARVEMLIQQWLLARPEMRDFLQSRPMVPYTEAWMPQVDTMKTLQGWSDVTVTHFHDLATFGEEILLSIRYGDWIDLNDESHAKNWARYWRPEIQSYIHAYRTVTGIDLTNPDTVDYTMPAVHLQKRLALQRAR